MARSRADSTIPQEDDYKLPAGFRPNPEHLDRTPDLTNLVRLEEPHAVLLLRNRYLQDEIYTMCASVMVAINPYHELGIYGEDTMNQYRGRKRVQLAQLPPHVFRLAEESYQLLVKKGVNSSHVICGESGSGKTETAKALMRYLAKSTSGAGKKAAGPQVETQFIEAQPTLEAFGNAQTIMNNNSSRFGKFTKIMFAPDGSKIIGSSIEHYLLEKIRVVHQGKGERGYHIFYQLMAGLDSKRRKEWGIEDPSKFHYTNQSGVYKIYGVDDAEQFDEVRKSMASLLIDEKEQEDIFRVVAGILHLGNVGFDTSDADAVKLDKKTAAHVDKAAELFGVDRAGLEKRLTKKSIKVGAQVIAKDIAAGEAEFNRDAIAKSLYVSLFKWLISRINKELFLEEARSDDVKFIGVLDIFGFESSDYENSLEQLFINVANERLQQFFTERIISSEQDEYLAEALPWTPLEVADNQDTLDMVQGKPNGLVAILDSACVMPGGTDEVFITNLFAKFGKHARIKQARARPMPKDKAAAAALKAQQRKGGRERFEGFTVDHYAMPVTYNAAGFLNKNNDSSDNETVVLFCGAASNAVTAALMADEAAVQRRRAFKSVGTYFLGQLDSLLKTLRATSPFFVRCIAANSFKEPQAFDAEYVVPQLRCAGLMEALRVLKLGFPSRVPYGDIYERYGSVLPFKCNPNDFAEALFLGFGMHSEDYQLGLSKVFFRPGKQDFLEEVLANPELPAGMEAKIRSLLVRRRVKRVRAGLLALVRAELWVKKSRAAKRFAGFGGTVYHLARALAVPLLQVREDRSARALQSAVRAALAARALADKRRAVACLQALARRDARRSALAAELERRAADTAHKRGAAASAVQRFARRVRRRAEMGAELDRRVAATAKRVAEAARLADAERAAAEAERQRQLSEEKARAEKAAEEARRKAEQEAKERAEQEAKERAEQESARLAAQQERAANAELAEMKRRAAEQEEARRREEAEAEEEEQAKQVSMQRRRRGSLADRWAIEQLQQSSDEYEKKKKAEADRIRKEEEERERAHEEKLKLKEEMRARAKQQIEADKKDRAARPAPPPTPPPVHILLKYHKFTSEEEAAHMRQMLLDGAKFLKYGRTGRAHIKHVALNVAGQLFWSDTHIDPKLLRPSESFVDLKDVTEVLTGKQTAVFKRSVAERSPDHLCFSIVTKGRTLDLQAVAGEQRDVWVRAIMAVSKDLKDGTVTNMVTGDATDPRVTVAEHEAKVAAEEAEQKAEEAKKAGDFSSLLEKMAVGAEVASFSTLTGESLLQSGEKLIRHARTGKPKPRWVNCSQKSVYWGGFKQPSLASGSSFLPLADVVEIAPGKSTDALRRKAADDVPKELCLSIITKDDSLDLQTATMERRDAWVDALKEAVVRAKKNAHAAWIASKRAQSVAGRRSITGKAAVDSVDLDTELGSRVRSASRAAESGELPKMDVEMPDGGMMPQVIASMSRRGSVELLAANLAQNFSRQAAMQGPSMEDALPAGARPPPPSGPIPESLRDMYARRRSQAGEAAGGGGGGGGGAAPKTAAVVFAEKGGKLVKHGRLGKPKERYVAASNHRLFWGGDKNPASSMESSFVQLAECQKVVNGKETEVFQKKGAKAVDEKCAFSLVLKARSLDLVAPDEETRDMWVDALKVLVYQAKKAAHNVWLARKRQQSQVARARTGSVHAQDGALPQHHDPRDATRGSISVAKKE